MEQELAASRRYHERQHFVEEIGLLFERSGTPRMAGRILGWLLIADPPHQSTDQLIAALSASKGSVSMMTRLLIQIGLIERIALPGQRRDYFRVRPNAWARLLREQSGMLTVMRETAERGLALLADETAEHRRRLEEMRDFYAFFEREFPGLLARWEAEHDRQNGHAR